MNKEVQPRFVRVAEAARMLSMARSTVYDAIRAGTLPAVRIDGKVRIPLAALREFERQAFAASVEQ
jgi:excisionase family DNA binding protein